MIPGEVIYNGSHVGKIAIIDIHSRVSPRCTASEKGTAIYFSNYPADLRILSYAYSTRSLNLG